LLRILGAGASGEAYNVGSEHPVSIAELAQQVGAASGVNTPVRIHGANRVETPPPRYIPDTLKARRELGLSEYTALPAALLKTFQWSRSAAAL